MRAVAKDKGRRHLGGWRRRWGGVGEEGEGKGGKEVEGEEVGRRGRTERKRSERERGGVLGQGCHLRKMRREQIQEEEVLGVGE
ncbi:hypothetical protein CLOP_g17687 [Closterium sp. NIES-67]|nr:hypothetical protein CLOP_g17687 [Closterium sp. NIES-67]